MLLRTERKSASEHYLDVGALKLRERTTFIDRTMNDGGWREPRPWNRVFMPCLDVVIQQNPPLRSRLYVDPTLRGEKARASFNVGVFNSTFGKWGLILNWTTSRKEQVIPPNHIAVGYKDMPMGVLGPFANVRECWRCGLRGFWDDAHTRARVLPGRPCPNCHTLDWYGQIVRPAHLQRDAAEALADTLSVGIKQERWFDYLEGDSQEQIRTGEFAYGVDTPPGDTGQPLTT